MLVLRGVSCSRWTHWVYMFPYDQHGRIAEGTELTLLLLNHWNDMEIPADERLVGMAAGFLDGASSLLCDSLILRNHIDHIQHHACL